MRKFWILAIFFQIFVLIFFVFWAKFPIYFGNDLQIKTKVFDPRDMLRGNYVALFYEFSEIKTEDDLKGTKIYAVFDDKKPANFKKFSFQMPTNQNFIIGKVQHCYDDKCLIKYGIEAYFVPQKTAIFLEKQNEFLVNLKINNGVARIVSLDVNGTTF